MGVPGVARPGSATPNLGGVKFAGVEGAEVVEELRPWVPSITAYLHAEFYIFKLFYFLGGQRQDNLLIVMSTPLQSHHPAKGKTAWLWLVWEGHHLNGLQACGDGLKSCNHSFHVSFPDDASVNASRRTRGARI